MKRLREYEGAGLIYTAGRTAAGYRLFDEEAVWCVALVGNLRGPGLTLAEVRDLAGVYLQQPDVPIGPKLAELLDKVRGRIDARITELQQVMQRIDEFESRHVAELAGGANFRARDPHFSPRTLDSHPGGDPRLLN